MRRRAGMLMAPVLLWAAGCGDIGAGQVTPTPLMPESTATAIVADGSDTPAVDDTPTVDDESDQALSANSESSFPPPMVTHPLPEGLYNDNFSGISGSLTGDPATGCVWLDTTDGPTAVVWPPGLRAAFEPLRILAPDDRLLAVGGEQVLIGGSYAPSEEAARVPEGPCKVSAHVWSAHHHLEFTFTRP